MEKFQIDRLKNLSIKEVAERLGLNLINNKCNCFLHDERTPSFSISPKKNMWHCFGCGKGGDTIKLVEEYNRCSFQDACKWLSNIYNIENSRNRRAIHIRIKRKSRDENIPNPEIYKWFFDNLTVTENVKTFIKCRRYPDEIIEKYNLKGIDDCNSFFEKCKAKWGEDQLIRCGIAKETVNRQTGEITCKFTWWTNTLFFPFYNNEGDIIYIQGRTLNSRYVQKSKYVNLYNVETIPFNLQILKSLALASTLVITEGVTDCISSCIMGKNAIGIIGSNGFKKIYAMLLKEYEIIVIPDNDMNKTGDRFAERIRKEFIAIGKTINIYPLIGFKDISEYYMNKWEHGKID